MPKPRINTHANADHHSGPDEKIIEFDGGLISFMYWDDAKTLQVNLYRLDDNVQVIVDPKHLHPNTLKQAGTLLGVPGEETQ